MVFGAVPVAAPVLGLIFEAATMQRGVQLGLTGHRRQNRRTGSLALAVGHRAG